MTELGGELTVTVVVEGEDVPQAVARVTLYSPAFAVVALAMVGFCALEVKLLGPVQL